MIQIDMPIPENCADCRFSQGGYMYCHAMPENFCGYVNYCEEDGRPEWCPLKAQEPVEPKIVDTSNSKLYHNDMFKNHYCGNCGEFLHVVNRKDMFCSQCGRAVKWDD